MQIGGYLLLVLTALPQFSAFSFLLFAGLLLASVGFGANKTCFVTYGCQQVKESVERRRRGRRELEYGGWSGDKELDLTSSSEERIASQRYLTTIMMGSQAGYIFSTFFTPIIRVKGAGSYFYVFLLPLVSKTVGTLAFWLGRDDVDSEGSSSIKQGDKSCQESVGEHTKLIDGGLAKAEDCPTRTWDEYKALLSALIVLLPLIVYAALAAQGGSTWVFQARRMNGHLPWLGDWTIPPDQMPVRRLYYSHFVCFINPAFFSNSNQTPSFSF